MFGGFLDLLLAVSGLGFFWLRPWGFDQFSGAGFALGARFKCPCFRGS